MRRLLLLAAAACLAAPASAAADGGGLLPTFGGAGASAHGHPYTYVAMPYGNRTQLQAIVRAGGRVEQWRMFRGTWGIPSAAYDGSTTGLSGDGRTLVLAESPRTYPPKHSRLLVLDAKRLRPRARITLPGFASVDAISPDGRWIYFVDYVDPRSHPTDYEVRVYDLKTHKIARDPIVDPEEPDENMGGYPYSRVTSADGRWAYTFYAADEPFVHALDTVGRTAKCIDLPQLAHEDLGLAQLKLDGGLLHVGRLATVDTRTFAVSRPRPARPRATPAPPPAPADGRAGWPFVVLGAALLALAAFTVRRRSVHHRPDRHPAVERTEEQAAL